MNFFLKYIENELLICLVENQPNNFVLTEISKNRSHVISRTFLQNSLVLHKYKISRNIFATIVSQHL